MRSLLSGIFKENIFVALRARKLLKTLKASNESQQPIQTIDGEISYEQKAFLLKKEREDERQKKQYEEQFSKVEATIRREPRQLTQEELVSESKRRYKDSARKEKQQQHAASKGKNVNNNGNNNFEAKFYDERELTAMIRKQNNPEGLFRLYNGHKFTYTTKNLVHTLTLYATLVKKEHKMKIKNSDRRLQTLLFTLKSYSSKLSNKEKTLVLWSLCKLGMQEDLSEQLIKELVPQKQMLEFKDISIILWVMGKQSIKNIQQINEFLLEISLRLEDPYVKIENPPSKEEEHDEYLKTQNKKTDDQMEFEELEELLELPDFKENIIEPQSLSMIIWSLGKLGVVDEDFLNLSIHSVTENIKEFSPLMISNILYALSNIKFKNAKLFDDLCSHLLKDMKKLEEQPVLTLKTLFIAVCKLKVKNEEFHKTLVRIILAKSTKAYLSSRFSSEIIYYLAKGNIFDEKIYTNLAKNVGNVVGQMNVQDCCEVLYAFTKYVGQHKELLIVINLVCLRLIELEGKLDKKSKNMIEHSLKIGGIQKQNKLLAIVQK